MRLLVIEDDETQRELFVALLEAEGFECDAAGSLTGARALLRKRTYPLVVADYHLPDGFSLELLDRHEVEAQRFMLVSGHTAIDRPDDLPFFQKPIDIDQFTSQLRQKLSALQGALPDEAIPAPRARAPRPSADGDETHAVELALYIAPNSISSRLARERLMRVLEQFDTRTLTVELIDVTSAALTRSSERVLFTPTLVCRRPLPSSMLVGDLRDETALAGLLRNAGLPPRPGRHGQEPK